jgi:hypothetical protein
MVFRGVFLDTPEEWSFSTKWESEISGSDDWVPDEIDAPTVRTALDTLFNTANFGVNTRCTEWRAYQIGADGKVIGDNLRTEELAAPGPTGASSLTLPPQVSIAVTTEAASRGLAKLGRFFLPGPSHQTGTGMKMTAAQAQQRVQDVTTFLKAISDAWGNKTGQSCDLVNVSNVGAGRIQSVTNLRVGRVYDVINRRRRQMLEEYEVNATPIDW